MAKQTAREIIEKKMPNLEVISSSSDDTPEADSSDTSKQSIEDLRRKFLGEDEKVSADAADNAGNTGDDTIEVVEARKKLNLDDTDGDPVGKRQFIFSNGELLGGRG